MMLWKLFLTFLEIGTVSFGGGYGMISLIREKVLANGWLTEGELLDFIAVSESTPGPLAINMATFIGSAQCGFSGAFFATLGVVLPSFLIILLIAALISGLLRYPAAGAFLGGVRPAVVGLILATGILMLIGNFLGVYRFGDSPAADIRELVIFAFLAAFSLGWRVLRHRSPSPILIILVSALFGIVIFAR